MAAYEDQTVAGFWCAADKFVETDLGIAFEFKPHESWLFAARVDKDFQNRGIHQRVIKSIITELNDSGTSNVLLSVNPNNRSSIVAHQRHATKLLGKVLAIRLLNVTACFCSGPDVRIERSFTLNASNNPIYVHLKSSAT